MQQVTPPAQRDPAPSRVKYKLHRLWLTPIFRALIRTGVPILCIAIVTLTYLQDPTVQKRIVANINNARTMLEERPEFMVKQMRIQGASGYVDELARGALGIEFPVSSFQLDLITLKQAVENIDAVESVTLLVGAHGVLEVGIVERVPALIWRSPEGLILLDKSGHKSGQITSRLARKDLPLALGIGVDRVVPQALKIFKKLEPLSGRVRGLMRVGDRRWDVALDRNQVLKLPETQPIAALARVFALHKAQDILNRDIVVVDVRDGRKPILRLTAPALDGMKKLRLLANGEGN